MSTPVFGYWDIRGLAEPIRLLLHSQGVQFEDKRYLTPESWQADKSNLGLDFPNLPYWIEGDLKLTQSLAILRYLARKYDMGGRTDEEKIRVDLAEQQLIDFRRSLGSISYSPEFENLKDELIRNIPTQMKLFSDFLGNRKYFAGDNLTYVDFMAYETLDYYCLFWPKSLIGFKNLQDFQDRIENLPSIQEYLESPVHKWWPFFLPTAYFSGKGEAKRGKRK